MSALTGRIGLRRHEHLAGRYDFSGRQSAQRRLREPSLRRERVRRP